VFFLKYVKSSEDLRSINDFRAEYVKFRGGDAKVRISLVVNLFHPGCVSLQLIPLSMSAIVLVFEYTLCSFLATLGRRRRGNENAEAYWQRAERVYVQGKHFTPSNSTHLHALQLIRVKKLLSSRRCSACIIEQVQRKSASRKYLQTLGAYFRLASIIVFKQIRIGFLCKDTANWSTTRGVQSTSKTTIFQFIHLCTYWHPQMRVHHFERLLTDFGEYRQAKILDPIRLHAHALQRGASSKVTRTE